MSRRDAERLDDMLAAIAAIRDHLERGDLADPVIFDAVRMRLVELGEAAKALSQEIRDLEPEVPWRQVAAMRNRLTHRYFQNELGIIRATVQGDLQPLERAVTRLKARLQEQ